MAGGDAHALDIRGTDALLAGGHTMTGRLLLCQEPLLHGSHTAVDQQQAGVVLGHQREAVQTQMALTFKKAQVLFAQFIQTGPLHKFSLLNCPWRLHVRFFMMLWQRGRQAQKTKQPPSRSRDEGCAAQNSVVPPKLQRINCPLPLSAR